VNVSSSLYFKQGILKLIKKELDEIELVTLKRKEGYLCLYLSIYLSMCVVGNVFIYSKNSYFPLSLENFDIQAAEQRDKEQRKQFLEKQKRHALQALYNLNKRKTKQVDRASSSKQSFPTKNEFSIF